MESNSFWSLHLQQVGQKPQEIWMLKMAGNLLTNVWNPLSTTWILSKWICNLGTLQRLSELLQPYLGTIQVCNLSWITLTITHFFQKKSTSYLKVVKNSKIVHFNFFFCSCKEKFYPWFFSCFWLMLAFGHPHPPLCWPNNWKVPYLKLANAVFFSKKATEEKTSTCCAWTFLYQFWEEPKSYLGTYVLKVKSSMVGNGFLKGFCKKQSLV